MALKSNTGLEIDVRESASYIANRSNHVKIVDEGVERVANLLHEAALAGKLGKPNLDDCLHPSADIDEKKAIEWIFLVDTLNFSFWTDDNIDNQFIVTDTRGMKQTGYNALVTCVNKALENGMPVTNAHFCANVTLDAVSRIFVGDNGVLMPMLKQRQENMQEIGRILLQRFDGSFYNCLLKCNKSARALLSLVVENFPCFKDEAEYDDRKVWLLKRAQILVADIWSSLRGTGLAEFSDIDSLTMFADYRVPQVLFHFGALNYFPELLKRLNLKQLMTPGERMEVELRGCSIEAVEKIVARLQELLEGSQSLSGGSLHINAATVDYFLWCYRREHAAELEAVPFHRVRSIYY